KPRQPCLGAVCRLRRGIGCDGVEVGRERFLSRLLQAAEMGKREAGEMNLMPFLDERIEQRDRSEHVIPATTSGKEHAPPAAQSFGNQGRNHSVMLARRASQLQRLDWAKDRSAVLSTPIPSPIEFSTRAERSRGV